MLYYNNGSFTRTPRILSGASLAQRLRRMSPPERAVLGADILDGRVVLQGLTAKTIAEIVGVNQSYLFAAARATPEQRMAIARGSRPVILPPALPAPIDWRNVDDDVLVEAVRLIGVDRALNAAVAVEHTT
jgi:hypothetical protein